MGKSTDRHTAGRRIAFAHMHARMDQNRQCMTEAATHKTRTQAGPARPCSSDTQCALRMHTWQGCARVHAACGAYTSGAHAPILGTNLQHGAALLADLLRRPLEEQRGGHHAVLVEALVVEHVPLLDLARHLLLQTAVRRLERLRMGRGGGSGGQGGSTGSSVRAAAGEHMGDEHARVCDFV
jgi:hypothetical protein